MTKSLKILILEDAGDDIELITRTLKKEGIKFENKNVDTKDDYIQALIEFKPHVILSDHSLPQFDSMQALMLYKKQGLNIPFILVTGTVSEEFAVNCLKQGADDYILKSNLARLPSAITNALKQRQYDKERKKAERALREQNEELVKINNEMDSFVYSVSHNLRAPLKSVLGLIDLAQKDDESRENALGHYFDMMDQSVQKLDETLKEILDYSRNAKGEINIQKVDIGSIIEGSFEALKYVEGSDKIIKDVVIDGGTVICSDMRRLTIIFNNLISNSIKYRDENKSEQFIKISIKNTSDNTLIVFQDNGIGISSQYIARIFDMFFRATERSEGAGLGLYIVKETVEKLKGNISIESKINEGTTFKINLPNHSLLFNK